MWAQVFRAKVDALSTSTLLGLRDRIAVPNEAFKMMADAVREEATRSVANAAFNRALLFFGDGSHLRFEHTSRQNRWAKASEEGSMAENTCLSITQFRLNAKHLELFFEDGSTVEFHPSVGDEPEE